MRRAENRRPERRILGTWIYIIGFDLKIKKLAWKGSTCGDWDKNSLLARQPWRMSTLPSILCWRPLKRDMDRTSTNLHIYMSFHSYFYFQPNWNGEISYRKRPALSATTLKWRQKVTEKLQAYVTSGHTEVCHACTRPIEEVKGTTRQSNQVPFDHQMLFPAE